MKSVLDLGKLVSPKSGKVIIPKINKACSSSWEECGWKHFLDSNDSSTLINGFNGINKQMGHSRGGARVAVILNAGDPAHPGVGGGVVV